MKNFKEISISKVLEARLDPEKAKAMVRAIQKAKLKLLKNKGKIIDKLVRKGLIKGEERINYSQDYLVEYLNVVANIGELKKMAGGVPAIMTISKDILARRDELEGKFSVKIKDPSEMIDMIKKENSRLTEYIG